MAATASRCAGYSRDYGNRVGIWRLFEVMDRPALRQHGANVRSATTTGKSSTRRASAKLGLHGIYNTRYVHDMTSAERADREHASPCSGTGPVARLAVAGATNTERTPNRFAEYTPIAATSARRPAVSLRVSRAG